MALTRDRNYATYLDPQPSYRWADLESRAAVCYETFRDRMRRGWALEAALMTPKTQKRSVVARVRTIVAQSPGICAQGLLAELPDVGKVGISRAVVRDVQEGRLRTIKVPGQNPDESGYVLGYVLVPVKDRPVRTPAEPERWRPVPWVHPIRARALGLTPPPTPTHPLLDPDFSHPMKGAA